MATQSNFIGDIRPERVSLHILIGNITHYTCFAVDIKFSKKDMT